MLVVTTYFNPMKSHRRLTNYRAFRSRLNAPLLTVELSFDGQFELTSADADHLIQLSGGDVVWQKERLLNIALGAVPDDVENVAWIDCDVVFESRNWPQAAKKALKSDSIIQGSFEQWRFCRWISRRCGVTLVFTVDLSRKRLRLRDLRPVLWVPGTLLPHAVAMRSSVTRRRML